MNKKKTKRLSETLKDRKIPNKIHLHTQQQSWASNIHRSKKAYSRKGKNKWNPNKEN